MKEDVLVLLDERQPLKAQMADALTCELQKRGFVADRLGAAGSVVEILKARAPKIVVLDYVLGDVATAFDLLPGAGSTNNKTRFILWTDEPSVSVAVSALKAGAADYIELSETGENLKKVIEAIQNLSLLPEEDQSRRQQYALPFDPPVAHEPCYVACLEQAHAMARINAPLTVILGPAGSGRNTVARVLHHKRAHAGEFIELDFDLFAKDVAHIFGDKLLPHIVPLLSCAATLFVDHIEFDSEEFFAKLLQHKDHPILTTQALDSPMLVIGTSDKTCARLAASKFNACVIEIPPLEKRPSDILPLIQKFTASLKTLTKSNKLEFPAALIPILETLSWPGNVRQLQSVISETLLTEVRENQPFISNPEPAPRTFTEEQQIQWQILIQAKTRWETCHFTPSSAPLPFQARRALDQHGGSTRLAAITLGTEPLLIQQALCIAGVSHE